MAYKKYAYYNKGNKIALIEQSNSTSSGKLAVAHCTISGYTTKDTCEAAGGQWIPGSSGSTDTVGEYKSPVESITKGLEIEYTYSPIYRRGYRAQTDEDAHRFLGWGSDGENLVLLTFGTSTKRDISSTFAADQWILIDGGGRWSGLHKVKSASAGGVLTTYTRCTLPWNILSNESLNLGSNEVISTSEAAVGADFDLINELELRPNVYIFITDAAQATNDGFYKIILSDTTGTFGTVTEKYSFASGSGLFQSTTTVSMLESDDDSVSIYNANLDEMIVYEGIEVLSDETFELDLTRHQSNAVVYYLQAKKFEELGDIERFEYYMRQFKKQLEKGSSSRKYGAHMVQGHWNMRR